MNYRQLGRSDLKVSEVSLGSWLTFGGGIERARAEGCIQQAFEVGINFIDTANVYGRGAAETFLGEALQGRRRDSYILATKLFFPMTSEDQGLSRAQVHKQLDASLARLKTDYVDLYQCHRFDPHAPLEETLHALTEVVNAGKTRYIGFSEWNRAQIEASLGVSGAARFVSSQPQYSMLWRAPEREVIPFCQAHGIGQIVWSPLAQGILTGKYLPGQPPPKDSRASSERMGGFIGRWQEPQMLAAVQELKPIAAELGLSMAQLALAWVLRQPNVSSAIIGATKPEQVTDNAKTSGVKLTSDTLGAIDQALRGLWS